MHRDESHQPGALTPWGARAAGIYTEAYAARYRTRDETAGEAVAGLAAWLRAVCGRFEAPIDALDLGCGTGRYFGALMGVRALVGIDVSKPMLKHAERPISALATLPSCVTLVEGDFLQYEFDDRAFDLVYAIGVLAEHSPFNDTIAHRVARWLRPGGRFAFTVVDPLSPSVPRTAKRRAGERLLPWLTGSARRVLRAQLMRHGLYADEERLRDVLGGAGFLVESIDPFESDVHRHLLAVARRPT
jgi:SAM-dependent methyltransferase